MFAPAMIPVTAGKNSANIVQKLSLPENDGRMFAANKLASNDWYAPA